MLDICIDISQRDEEDEDDEASVDCWTQVLVEWSVQTSDTQCVQLQSGGMSEGAISVSVGLWWPDWRLTAAADDDERVASLLSGDQGMDSGPGPALPPTGQTRDNINSAVSSSLEGPQ